MPVTVPFDAVPSDALKLIEALALTANEVEVALRELNQRVKTLERALQIEITARRAVEFKVTGLLSE